MNDKEIQIAKNILSGGQLSKLWGSDEAVVKKALNRFIDSESELAQTKAEIDKEKNKYQGALTALSSEQQLCEKLTSQLEEKDKALEALKADSSEALKVYNNLFSSKTGRHFIWFVASEIASGEKSHQALANYGFFNIDSFSLENLALRLPEEIAQLQKQAIEKAVVEVDCSDIQNVGIAVGVIKQRFLKYASTLEPKEQSKGDL